MPLDERGEAGRDERGDRDHGEQDDPDGRLQERERPAAGVVVHLEADDRVAGDVGDARRSAPSRTTSTTTTTRFGISAMSASGIAAPTMLQAEQPAPAEAAQDAQAEEHAQRPGPMKIAAKTDAPARAAAVQGVLDVGRAEPDHHAAGRERADHPDDEARGPPGLADEPPALPDGLGHRWRGDVRAGAALGDLPQRVDGQRGHGEGEPR